MLHHIMMVNGKNYFNEKSLAEMIERLQQGRKITIYIDCIGHTRTAIETQNYEEALKEKFGDKLVKSKENHWEDYYYLDE